MADPGTHTVPSGLARGVTPPQGSASSLDYSFNGPLIQTKAITVHYSVFLKLGKFLVSLSLTDTLKEHRHRCACTPTHTYELLLGGKGITLT